MRSPPRIASIASAVLLLLCTLLLSACGGGGGSSSEATSPGVQTDSNSLSFSSLQDGSKQTQTITATYKGDGLIIGFAPGVYGPGWLVGIENTGTGTKTAVYTITVDPTGITAGTYKTSLRFVTGNIPPGGTIDDATNISYIDIPVSLYVSALQAAIPAPVALISGGTSTTTGSLSIGESSGTAWTASTSQSWLKLQGGGTGPGNLNYSIDTSTLTDGDHIAQVTLTETRSGLVYTVPVQVSRTAPQLTLSNSSLSFSINANSTAANLVQSLGISDQINGASSTHAANWSISSIDVPWLSASASNGSTAPAGYINVSLVGSQLATLGNGTFTGHINFSYTTEDSVSHSLVLPVSINTSLPLVRYVAPYAVSANSQYPIVITGSGFSNVGNAHLLIGSTTISDYAVVSDNEIDLTYPALAAGTYKIQFSNPLGNTITGATLTVRADGALPATAIALGTNDSTHRIIYDERRQILYGIGYLHINRVALVNGSWVPQAPISLPTSVMDAALTADGNSLILAAGNESLYILDITSSGAQPVLVAKENNSDSEEMFMGIVCNNQNVALITSGHSNGKGNSPAYSYNINQRTLGIISDSYELVSGSNVAISGNGETVLVMSSGLAWAPTVRAYNNGMSYGYYGSYASISSTAYEASLSRDGSRILLNGELYDSSLNRFSPSYLVGNTISPDGQRGYYVNFTPQTYYPSGLTVIDLSNSPFTPLQTISLPSTITSSLIYTKAISNDGKTFFLWGQSGLAVIPLQ